MWHDDSCRIDVVDEQKIEREKGKSSVQKKIPTNRPKRGKCNNDSLERCRELIFKKRNVQFKKFRPIFQLNRWR